MINDTNIKVNMIIDNTTFDIKKDAVATIGSDGLVGSMIIVFCLVTEKNPVEPGDKIVLSPHPHR
jgi:phospholipid/cholesterol/gamma-HCH transport system substrate-binding protein